MSLKIIITLMIMISASLPAFAQEEKSGSITYMLTTKEILDPDPADKKDRVLFFIKGEAAKDIFEEMDATLAKKDCAGQYPDKGVKIKKSRGLECRYDDESGYQCTLGVLLKTGETVQGYICD